MKNIRDLLIYSLDNDLSQTDKIRLEKALKEDEELQKEKGKLLKMRGLFANYSVSERAGFADNIIGRIEGQDDFQNQAFNVRFIQLFPKVAAACVVFLLVAFSVVYFSDSMIVSDTIVGIEEMNIEDAYAFLEN